jgi:predicted nucleic acid-binding protein
MNVIFLDTNIYLRFYNSNKPAYKKLLEKLVNISENIFITEQIIVEIERNKLNRFKESIDNYKTNIAIPKVYLPEHFSQKSNASITAWNKKRKEIESKNKELGEELEKIIDETYFDIQTSNDFISKQLYKIFKNAIKESDIEYQNAKRRKERGNPPGKKTDTLGDQITWEQLLNNVNSFNAIWIITADGDYYNEYKKKCYLNPFLLSEIKKRNSNLKVHCFNNIVDGLNSFLKANKVTEGLAEELIKEIKEEEQILRSPVASSNITSIGYNPTLKILEIEYRHGAIYRYFDVSREDYENLRSASSHGSYFSNNIRNEYEFEKL